MKRCTPHPAWVEPRDLTRGGVNLAPDEQSKVDARVRDEVKRIVAIWGKLTAKQRARIRARLRDRKS